MSEKDVYLSFLPLAHIFDRVIEELFIWTGASIGFWRGVSTITHCSSLTVNYKPDITLFLILQDVKLLTEDIGELKPTIFCAVPRVLDRIYAGTFLTVHDFSHRIEASYSLMQLYHQMNPH